MSSAPAPSEQQLAFRHARALERSGHWTAAEQAYTQLLSRYPQHKAAMLQRANVLQRLGRAQEALVALQSLLSLDPLLPAAHCNLGALLEMQGDGDGAALAYARALELDPGLGQALTNWTALLDRAGQHAEADRLIEAALQHGPDRADLRFAWARRLRLSQRPHEAAAQLRMLLRRKPDDTGALLELGGVLMLLSAYDAARNCYERLLRLDPHNRMALYSLGQTLETLGREEEALQANRAALAIDPSAVEVLCQYEFLRLSLCDWDDYAARMASLHTRLEQRAMTPDASALPMSPLRLQSFPLPLPLQRTLAQHWSDSIDRDSHALRLPPAPPRAASDTAPIRVAYLSADFADHPMGRLIHGLFACHDRRRFEVFAYSLSGRDDAVTASVRRGVDHFCDAAAMDAPSLAQRIRTDRIDVLIDLMGHTHDSRPAVLAMRPAPLQLHYLGYPGSMGADFLDGVIADHWLIPPELEAGYRETVYRVPCAFVWSAPAEGSQAQDPVHDASRRRLARTALGLPADATVYACFNRAHKLDPLTFDLWLDILRQVPASVLCLIQESPLVQQRLRASAIAHGVDASRIVFTPRVPSAGFEALCSLADLFLDTRHYGAGATGLSALHAGLPLLTQPGASFASRMGASLCAATGLQELICDSESAYRETAVDLGRHPEKLAHIRHRLRDGGAALPLFQTARWVAEFEGLLIRLVQRLPVRAA